MRWTRLLLCAVAAGSNVAQAAAENWRLIAKDDRGSEFVDLGNVQSTGSERVFRVKVVFTKPIGDTASMEAAQRVDCSLNTIIDLGYRFFGPDGKVVGGNINMSGDPPKSIDANSDRMTIRNLVC